MALFVSAETYSNTDSLQLTQMLDQENLHRSEYDRQVFKSLPRPQWLDAAAGHKVLEPNPDYIAPSLFSHNLQVNQYIHKLLRSRDLADKIMETYWKSVHPVACIVHRPSFQERYDLFWCNGSKGIKDIPESTQALVYAALFAGVVSMDAGNVREELGGKRQDWVEALEKATAISLSRAHVIRTEKPETIQAFVMYLVRKAWACKFWTETCSTFPSRPLNAPPCDRANHQYRSRCAEASFPAPSQHLSQRLSILHEVWDSIKTVLITGTMR